MVQGRGLIRRGFPASTSSETRSCAISARCRTRRAVVGWKRRSTAAVASSSPVSQTTTSASRRSTTDGAEHGVDGGHAAAGALERPDGIEERRLDAGDVHHDSRRRLAAPLAAEPGHDRGRRGAHDQVSGGEELLSAGPLLRRRGRVEGGGPVGLGRKEPAQPPAHAARAAGDHGAPARAVSRAAQAVLVLRRHRGPDEAGEELLGDPGIEAAVASGGPGALHDGAILGVVRGGQSAAALDLPHLPGEPDPLRRPLQQLQIETPDPIAKVVEVQFSHGNRAEATFCARCRVRRSPGARAGGRRSSGQPVRDRPGEELLDRGCRRPRPGPRDRARTPRGRIACRAGRPFCGCS